MKKIFILFIMCFMLTGCTTELTIKIDDKKIYEEFKIYDLKSNVYTDGIINETIKNNIEDFEREYLHYDIEELEESNIVGRIYKYDDELEYWDGVSLLRQCYESFNFSKTNSRITLNTSEEYRCGEFYGANEVKVVVESDLTLESSNADKVEGNKLIWNINEKNSKNKSIKFSFKLIDDDEKIIVDEEAQNNEIVAENYFKYILYILGIILLIAVVVIYEKIKKANK